MGYNPGVDSESRTTNIKSENSWIYFCDNINQIRSKLEVLKDLLGKISKEGDISEMSVDNESKRIQQDLLRNLKYMIKDLEKAELTNNIDNSYDIGKQNFQSTNSLKQEEYQSLVKVIIEMQSNILRGWNVFLGRLSGFENEMEHFTKALDSQQKRVDVKDYVSKMLEIFNRISYITLREPETHDTNYDDKMIKYKEELFRNYSEFNGFISFFIYENEGEHRTKQYLTQENLLGILIENSGLDRDHFFIKFAENFLKKRKEAIGERNKKLGEILANKKYIDLENGQKDEVDKLLKEIQHETFSDVS